MRKGCVMARWLAECLGRCGGCGKMSYSSRKAARAAAKRAFPGDKFNAYECLSNPGVFHFGHLPGKVRQGRMPRAWLDPDAVVRR